MKKRGNYKFLGKFSHYVPGTGGMFALLAWLLVGALFGGIITMILGLAMGPEFVKEYGTLISYPLMFVPPMLFASAKSSTNSVNNSGWKLDNSHFAPVGVPLCVLLALTGVFAMGFWTDGLVALLPDMPEVLKEALTQLVGGKVWVNFLTVSIFAPLCEEWLCRGMVLRGLLMKTRMKPVWAIIISAVFFALIHMNPWQAIPAFLIGCLLGYVYYRTGSLKLTMFMHFANNTLSLALGHVDSLKEMDTWMDIMPVRNYVLIASACFLLTVLVVLAFRKVQLLKPEGNIDEIPSLFEAE